MTTENIDFDYEKFIVIKEPWNLYKIEGGSILKFKLVLVKVKKTGQIDDQGTPGYNINTNQVLGVQSPKELRGEPSKPKKARSEIERADIFFETIKEDWNEYSLGDEFILKIKPAIVKISKAKDFDNTGEPIFRVQSQLLTKINKLPGSQQGHA